MFVASTFQQKVLKSTYVLRSLEYKTNGDWRRMPYHRSSAFVSQQRGQRCLVKIFFDVVAMKKLVSFFSRFSLWIVFSIIQYKVEQPWLCNLPLLQYYCLQLSCIIIMGSSLPSILEHVKIHLFLRYRDKNNLYCKTGYEMCSFNVIVSADRNERKINMLIYGLYFYVFVLTNY